MSLKADTDELENRFRAIADTTPIMIWTSGPDKLCTYFNASWLRFTGRTMEQEVGNGWTEGVHPDDLEGRLAKYVTAFDARQALSAEYRLRRRDGSYRWILDTQTPRYHADGSFAGYIGSGIDIDDRRQTEARLDALLRAAREDSTRLEALLRAAGEDSARLKAVLETVPDAIIVIDESGLVRSFSLAAERTFGYSAAEVVGRNVKMLMPSPYREEHDSYLDRYRRTGERRIIGIGRVVSGQRRDGTTFPIELSVGEAVRDGGRVFVGFVRDITERQATERRMEELQSELAHFSRINEMEQMGAALAHELNQPLTAMVAYLGAARQLVELKAAEEKILTMIDRAIGQATRTGAIIHRLREFVGKGQTARHPEPINRVVEEASALALIGAKQLNIQARLELDDTAPVVTIDRVQIQQVLVNLIRNAMEAMADTDRRELLVRTSADSSFVEVSICDTGHGLAPHVAAKLFQPFVSTKITGMGIGLSVCRSIVQSHGGEIRAQNNGDDPGTTFSFTLPIIRGYR